MHAVAPVTTSCACISYAALPVRTSTANRPYSTMLKLAVQSSPEKLNLVPIST